MGIRQYTTRGGSKETFENRCICVYTLRKVYEVYIWEVFERVWKVFEESEKSLPLLSSFATGSTSSRDSSSIMAQELVSVDSDDEDVEYKGDLGIPDVDDCATGSFCSTCAIPPRVAGGLWSAGVGCDACYFPLGVIRLRGRG